MMIYFAGINVVVFSSSGIVEMENCTMDQTSGFKLIFKINILINK
jgi:hypothetical protein